MLSCSDCLARHSEYMDGVLSAESAAEVRAHLAACPECARYDRVLRRGLQILQAQPTVEVGSDFFGTLQQRIAREDRRALRMVSALPAASIGVAAMLAFLAVLPVLMLRTPASTAVASEIGAVSPVATEIAWHGERAVEQPARAHVHLATRRSAWAPTLSAHVIEPKYTPVILESPTAPPSYLD